MMRIDLERRLWTLAANLSLSEGLAACWQSWVACSSARLRSLKAWPSLISRQWLTIEFRVWFIIKVGVCLRTVCSKLVLILSWMWSPEWASLVHQTTLSVCAESSGQWAGGEREGGGGREKESERERSSWIDCIVTCFFATNWLYWFGTCLTVDTISVDVNCPLAYTHTHVHVYTSTLS